MTRVETILGRTGKSWSARSFASLATSMGLSVAVCLLLIPAFTSQAKVKTPLAQQAEQQLPVESPSPIVPPVLDRVATTQDGEVSYSRAALQTEKRIVAVSDPHPAPHPHPDPHPDPHTPDPHTPDPHTPDPHLDIHPDIHADIHLDIHADIHPNITVQTV